MELKDWQEHVYQRVLSETTNIMVVAEQHEGKTTLLSRIQEETGAQLLDGINARGDEVKEAVRTADSLVLMDEGGAYRYCRELAESLESNPETQFVVGTLPDCPSMKMVEDYFEVVDAREFLRQER